MPAIKGAGIGFKEVYDLYQHGKKEDIGIFESLCLIDENYALEYLKGL